MVVSWSARVWLRPWKTIPTGGVATGLPEWQISGSSRKTAPDTPPGSLSPAPATVAASGWNTRWLASAASLGERVAGRLGRECADIGEPRRHIAGRRPADRVSHLRSCSESEFRASLLIRVWSTGRLEPDADAPERDDVLGARGISLDL